MNSSHALDGRNSGRIDQPLTIDLAAWRVQVGDRPVELTYQEFRTLLYLVSRAGEVVRRAEIAAALRTGIRGAKDRVADTYIARLRKKLGAAGWEAIRTVRQIGYRCELHGQESFRFVRQQRARGKDFRADLASLFPGS